MHQRAKRLKVQRENYQLLRLVCLLLSLSDKVFIYVRFFASPFQSEEWDSVLNMLLNLKHQALSLMNRNQSCA